MFWKRNRYSFQGTPQSTLSFDGFYDSSERCMLRLFINGELHEEWCEDRKCVTPFLGKDRLIEVMYEHINESGNKFIIENIYCDLVDDLLKPKGLGVYGRRMCKKITVKTSKYYKPYTITLPK